MRRFYPVERLAPGMLVDLEDCEYAAREDRENIFPFELARVDAIERETEDCIVVHFDKTSLGLPPDYLLAVECIETAETAEGSVAA